MDEPVRRGNDVQRILVFGDSFTFGWAVEYADSFFARVKQRVEERLPQVQLLNAGIGGYSTGHVTKYLRRLAARLDPCAAIYFMSATDPFDNEERHENYSVTSWARRSDGSIELEDRLAYTPLKRLVLVHSPYPWLKQNSHLFVLSMRAVRGLLGSRGEATRVGPRMGPAFGTLDLPAEQQRLLVDVSVEHLERLAEVARQSGVALQVVWIPAWTELFAPDAPINDMLETLRRRADAGALPDLVDPTARLAAAMTGRVPTEVYYRDGEPVGHFNPLGNALYADAVTGDVTAFAERAVAACSERRR
jgi:hypothetical protein